MARRRRDEPYSHPRWPAIRQIVLERDGRRCQVQLEGCHGHGVEVDHTKPWRDGGDWFALENLRASCKHCNISRASTQKHQDGWLRADTEIVVAVIEAEDGADAGLAVGPDDLVIDLHSLARAFGSTVGRGDTPARHHAEAASLAWQKLIAELRRGELSARRVWVITSDPIVAGGLPSHTVIRFDGGHDDVGIGGGDGAAGLEPGLWV